MKIFHGRQTALPLCLLVGSLTGLPGCAAFVGAPAKVIEDVSGDRAKRRNEAQATFDSTRDESECATALASWEEGNFDASEKILTKLLARNPKHRQARLLLADMYAASGEPIKAEQQLRQLLGDSPRDAQAMHALGLLLESIDRPEEALQQLQAAARMEPGNQLYVLSLSTMQPTLSTSRVQPASYQPSSGQTAKRDPVGYETINALPLLPPRRPGFEELRK